MPHFLPSTKLSFLINNNNINNNNMHVQPTARSGGGSSVALRGPENTRIPTMIPRMFGDAMFT